MTTPLLKIMLLTLLLITIPVTAQVDSATIWGDCSCFSIHSDAAITFDGVVTNVRTGDIGVSPGTSITGTFTMGTGVNHASDASSAACQTSKAAATTSISGLACTSLAAELGGTTVKPGVYCFGTFSITGTLTLDGDGNADSVFVFQSTSTLVTAAASKVVLTNGAQAKNVYFSCGSAGTIGAGSTFIGQIVAVSAITINSDAVVTGRLFAKTAITFASAGDVSMPVACSGAPPKTSDECVQECSVKDETNASTPFLNRCERKSLQRSCLSTCSNETEEEVNDLEAECKKEEYISELCDCGGGKATLTGTRLKELAVKLDAFTNAFGAIDGVRSIVDVRDGDAPNTLVVEFEYESSQIDMNGVFAAFKKWLANFLNRDESEFSIAVSDSKRSAMTTQATITFGESESGDAIGSSVSLALFLSLVIITLF